MILRHAGAAGLRKKNAGRDDLRQQRLAQDKKRRKRRIIKRVNQHHMLLALLYLLVTVVIMIANFITPEKSFSDQENRVLAGASGAEL